MKKALVIVAYVYVLALSPVTSMADPIRFITETFGCEVTVFGQPVGRVDPAKPLMTDLPYGREQLVECEGHDTPVKLYDRLAVGRYGGAPFMSGGEASVREITVHPVAVLPNAVKAAAARNLDVTVVADTSSLRCEVKFKNAGDTFQDESREIIISHPVQISKGTRVQVGSDPPLHCGKTNLIEIMIDGKGSWFRNRDFVFSYHGITIPLYSPSQDYQCCWIE